MPDHGLQLRLHHALAPIAAPSAFVPQRDFGGRGVAALEGCQSDGAKGSARRSGARGEGWHALRGATGDLGSSRGSPLRGDPRLLSVRPPA